MDDPKRIDAKGVYHMDEKRARAMLELWADLPLLSDDPEHAKRETVKIYRPAKEREETQKRTETPKRNIPSTGKMADLELRWKQWQNDLRKGVEKIWKKNRILAALALWTAISCGITAGVVRHNTAEEVTARVTSELRAGFSQYLADMEYEQSAASFLTGDASLQTAMDAEAEALAKLLYGYRNNSVRDRRTLIWCVLARVDSNAYPGSVEGVIAQQKQWMFYSDGNPIRDDDKNLALEQLKEWHNGRYPAGFSDDFVYAEWSQSDIALRNTWEKSSNTNWWRMPE